MLRYRRVVAAMEVMLAVVVLLVAMAAATAKATVQPQLVKHQATSPVVAMYRWVC